MKWLWSLALVLWAWTGAAQVTNPIPIKDVWLMLPVRFSKIYVEAPLSP